MSRPHRLTSDAYHGSYRYFLTICTYRRAQHFIEEAAVDLVRLEFLPTAAAHGFSILADCYMPDHMHAIVEGHDERSDLPAFVKLAKQRSGFRFRKLYGERLWQESYFDRTLRRDEELADVVRYLIANPVRAGLVETPDCYPYWGSGVFSRDEILEFVGITSSRV